MNQQKETHPIGGQQTSNPKSGATPPELVSTDMDVDMPDATSDDIATLKAEVKSISKATLAEKAMEKVKSLREQPDIVTECLDSLKAANLAMTPTKVVINSPAAASLSTASSDHSSDGILPEGNLGRSAHLRAPPKGLPYIQWRSHMFKQGETKFADPVVCLTFFEVILNQHTIPIDIHWKRMIPPKVSAAMLRWVMSVSDATPWAEFKRLFFSRYGHSPELVLQADAKQKLMTLSIRKKDLISEYIDRFEQLRAKADLRDNDPIFHRALLDPLPEDARRTLNVFNSISGGPDAALEPINGTIAKVKGVYDFFQKENHRDTIADAAISAKQTDHASHRECRSKRRDRKERKPYDRSSSSGSSEKSSTPYCTFHRSSGHSTDDCCAKKNAAKCSKCGSLYPKGQVHKCSSTADSEHNPYRKNDRSAQRFNNAKKFRSNSILSVPQMRRSSVSTDDDADIDDANDSDRDDHQLAFKVARMNIHQSKNTGASYSP
ncbi:hypothetical protein MBANPS3_012540 [Mucor bainieri]